MSTNILLPAIPTDADIYVDMFCGSGGTTEGAEQALDEKGGKKYFFIVINHSPPAIATHSANHPNALHLCQSIDTLVPEQIIPGRRVKGLLASPECTDHSIAKGGKPRSDQKRADAWLVLRWVEKLNVENLQLENVKEFMNWGPLNEKGLPDKRHRGKYFRLFIEALEINYVVRYAVLNAADYGDATTRQRFILIAKRKKPGKKIVVNFPEPTHCNPAILAKKQPSLLNSGKELKPWRTAREIIDWTLKGKSIFGRKKPLSENTTRRIFAGLFKYSLKEFLVNLKGTHRSSRSLNQPTYTQTASENQQMLVEPFLVKYFGGQHSEPLCKPIPTITANYEHYALCEPFIANLSHTQNNDSTMCWDIATPLRTICGKAMIGLIQPCVIPCNHGYDTRSYSVDDPMKTITSVDAWAVLEPFLVQYNGMSEAQPIDEPLGTVTTKDKFGLVEAHVLSDKYQPDDGEIGICFPTLGIIVFIRFRMLQPHELAAAMSFPKHYKFVGTRADIVRQIGNAVPIELGKACAKSWMNN